MQPFCPSPGKFCIRLIARHPLPSFYLGGGPIDMGEPFRGEKVIDDSGVFSEVILKDIRHILVNRFETGSRGAALRFVEELVVDLDLMHCSPLETAHSSILATRRREGEVAEQKR